MFLFERGYLYCNSVLSLWQNSTTGLLIHWTQGVRQDPNRARIGSQAVSKVPIPNFEELSESDIQKAKNYFLELSNRPLLICIRTNNDETRMTIDHAILDVMGMPQAQPILERIRELWSQEPTLRGISRH